MDYEKLINDRKVVASRINILLESNFFSLSIDFIKYIHSFLFKDIIDSCGNFRNTNISKEEKILNYDSVKYAKHFEIEGLLSKYLSPPFLVNKDDNLTDIVSKIVLLNKYLWQVHPFDEGNTRTIGVFMIMYLKQLGFNVTNDYFNNKAKYYRNSLVFASYSNNNGITTDYLPLIRFYEKLLIDDSYILDPKYFNKYTSLSEPRKK